MKNKIGIRQEIKTLKHSKFDNATLTSISDPSNSLLGLSNQISFVSEFFLKGG